ncbi:hypothetical protein X551_01196 [Methylibium sp. T29]|nr:hypothetical protein X551_01196 [Methylibium sp. T29]EWS57873.1 hypothetical protein Y694_04197 [Methylibium sp. T29-B]
MPTGALGRVALVLLRGPDAKPSPRARGLRHLSHADPRLRQMSHRVRARENDSTEIHRRPALTVVPAPFHNDHCSGVHAVLRAETVIRTRELEPVSTGGRRALTPAASPLPGWASSWGDLRSNHSHEGAHDERPRQARHPALADTRALPRLAQVLSARLAQRPARTDARSDADQRRDRLAVRHLGSVHRARRRDRREARPAQRAHALARRACRHRGLCRPAAPGAGRRREARGPRGPAHRTVAPRRRSAAAASAPCQGRRQRHADALCAPRHRHARDGVRGAARERQARVDAGVPRRRPARTAPARQPDGCADPGHRDARVRARRGGARPRHHPGQHQPPRSGADGDRPQLPGEDQRQHRQLGRHVEHRGRGGEAGVGDPLGRRQRDGPLHRAQHPHHARLDPAQLAGADRHRADLPSAREGGRRGRGPHLGHLPRHTDRAGRARRRLLHHPRRRAPALHPPHRGPPHRHRLAWRLDHGQVVHLAPPRELHLRALRGHLRHHEGLRRELLARRRPAPRLGRRRQRRGPVRRTAHAGRADPGGLEARRPDHDRRPGPRADAHDPGQHGRAARALPRGAVLHAGAADDRHRARLRPHRQRHRRGHDRLVRHRDAVLRDAQGTPGSARPRGREAGHRRLQDRRARGRRRQGSPRRPCPRRRAVQGALRVPLDGPVQPFAGPRHRTRLPRRDPAQGRQQGGALLLDVRAEVLLDEDHPGGARLRRAARRQRGAGAGRRHGREVEPVPAGRRRDLHPARRRQG